MANFENIKLDKGLYTTGKGFTQSLEELDPSINYIGTSLEGLDAYQRQLKRFGIKVSGRGSDCIEKFFSTTDSAALFPEYVSRAVKQGIDENNILPQIVATVTDINGLDYRTIASVPEMGEESATGIAQGADIPKTTIKTKENLVKLKKRGRILCASYEAIKFQRLDLFTVTLKQIGAYIAKQQQADAIKVLIEGDGNENAAKKVTLQDEGSFSYGELINFWNSFDPYTLNAIIASPDIMVKLLGLSEFRDAAAGLNFHATGKLITPFGAQLIKSSVVNRNTLIGIDKNCALEQVTAGGVMTEFDKLIDRQIERAAVTSICGFAKIYDDATKSLTIQ